MSIIIFLIILLVLVLAHEFGHFFSAKRFGMRVDEFGFGFPPRIFGVRKGETLYSFNLLPIGGFVKIFGENGEVAEPDEFLRGKVLPWNSKGQDLEEQKSTEHSQFPQGQTSLNAQARLSTRQDSTLGTSASFADKPKWNQAVVLFSGVLANFLLAWLLLSAGLMSGLPVSAGNGEGKYPVQDPHLVVTSVLPESPAGEAGLRPGDKIISAKTGDTVLYGFDPTSFKSFITSNGEGEIELGYQRGSEEVTATKLMPIKNSAGEFQIGIAMDMIGTAKLSPGRALWEGWRLNLSLTAGTVSGLYELIKETLAGRGSFSSVVGPVGLAGMAGSAYQFGLSYLLSFTALISINLAIINLVPFPALDGGRLLFLGIEKIKGSRISPKVAGAVNATGFILLIILILAITYHDILKLL